jgi:arylsulfatase A-like enzyme
MPYRLSVLTLVTLLLAGCAGTEPDAPRPNILFIFSDDHASAAISAYGAGMNETPHIDRLAREGMLFDNCLVTNSICAPSRATVLTGKYSHMNGQLTNRETFDGSQPTLPKLLREAGYQTALIGKWHLKSAPTGFDHYQVLIGQGPYYNPPIRTATDTTVIEGYTTDILTNLTLDWLREKRNPEQPFLLMYQHKAPHRNWQPGPDHLHTFSDTEFPLPPTFYDDYRNRSDAPGQANMRVDSNLTAFDLKITPPARLNEEQLAAWNAAYEPRNEELRRRFENGEITEEEFAFWKFQRYVKDYLRTVQSVDDGVGRVLDWLDENGLAENTIVVYTSDQGWYLGEHGWYDKRWMYEPSLKTPLLVRWPAAVAPGSRSPHMVSNLDFAPTFLDVAGAPIPADMQGRSFRTILENGDDPDWRSAFYYHYYEYPASHCVRRHYGVRTERYKLIHFYELGQWELFDLETDPLEMTSVYGDPAFADIQADLETRLVELRTAYAVPEDTRPSGECTMDANGWQGFAPDGTDLGDAPMP